MRRAELESFCATEYQRLVGTLTLYCGSHAVAQELAQDVIDPDSSDLERVSEEGGLYNDPTWSPDGRSIAFIGGNQIWVMRRDGRDLRTLGRG